LEDPETRHLATTDIKAFFNPYRVPLIIDEIQRVPDLLSMIQVIVDENPEHGSFILTGRIGQQLNLHSLFNDLGVSSTSLAEWLSVLEASWLVLRLHPWHGNVKKRLMKSPKRYFTDIGLASYLLGIENAEQAARDPLLGALFENLVVVEA